MWHTYPVRAYSSILYIYIYNHTYIYICVGCGCSMFMSSIWSQMQFSYFIVVSSLFLFVLYFLFLSSFQFPTMKILMHIYSRDSVCMQFISLHQIYFNLFFVFVFNCSHTEILFYFFVVKRNFIHRYVYF